METSQESIRTIYKSEEFNEFYESLNIRTKKKINSIIQIIENERKVTSNFAKKLKSCSELYELRIHTDNAYRVILFSIDNENIIYSKEVLFLNGFIKKSESDYKKQIAIAYHIRERFMKDEYEQQHKQSEKSS